MAKRPAKLRTSDFLKRGWPGLNGRNRKILTMIKNRKKYKRRHASCLGLANQTSAIVELMQPDWLLMHAAEAIIAGQSISPALYESFYKEMCRIADAIVLQYRTDTDENWKIQYRLAWTMPFRGPVRSNLDMYIFFQREDASSLLVAWMFDMLLDADYWKRLAANQKINFSILIYKWLKLCSSNVHYELEKKKENLVFLPDGPYVMDLDNYVDYFELKSKGYSLKELSKISWLSGMKAHESYNHELRKLYVPDTEATQICQSSQMMQTVNQSQELLHDQQQHVQFV